MRLILRETFLNALPAVRRGDKDGREDDTDEGVQEDDLYFNRHARASRWFTLHTSITPCVACSD